MKKGLDVFISYGHNEEAKNNLVEIIKSIKGITINIFILKDRIISGDSISEAYERLSLTCDLAIILATEDDYGSSKTSNTRELRARENVWVEYGYFWAKLGLSRTLLLVNKRITIPSDIGSRHYIAFRDNLFEVEYEIKRHILALNQQKPSSLTEILYLNNDANQLTRDWRELHELATYNLVITGISFANLRHDIPDLLLTLQKRRTLKLTILALDPFFMGENENLFQSLHGSTALQDNLSFFIALHNSIRDTVSRNTFNTLIKDKFRLKVFAGYFSGATVYCEDMFGSRHMIFQPFMYKARDRKFDYVRFRLKKRSDNGAFISIYNSLQVQMRKSRYVDLSYNEDLFIKKIKDYYRSKI